MNKKNFYVGMGMGLIVGSTTTMMLKSKSHSSRSTLGKSLRVVSEIADSFSDLMGW